MKLWDVSLLDRGTHQEDRGMHVSVRHREMFTEGHEECAHRIEHRRMTTFPSVDMGQVSTGGN